MDLIERVRSFRANLPLERVWNDFPERDRGIMMLSMLKAEMKVFNDWFMYDLYSKAHFELGFRKGAYMAHHFDHVRLMELFDLCERYAKNWVFA